MAARTQAAIAFRELHHDFLILPNAWDAVSARLIERSGARAIATSSAAVAWSHGHADGHGLPPEKLIRTVEEITRVVSAPVTVDMEAGYSDDPALVARTASALIDAGAVGVNLEDGRGPHDVHLRKIEAVRSVASRAGIDLFINARTDVYLAKLTRPDEAAEEAIRRGLACRDAGASGLFTPLVVAPDEIEAIAAAVKIPLNVIACPGLPPATELKRLGARRLSAGTEIARSALTALRLASEAFLADGDSTLLLERAGERLNLNALFTPGEG